MSFKRSTFVFLVFKKRYPVTQFRGLLINHNVPSTIRNGGMKADLHELALSVLKTVLRNSINLQVDWILRSLNDHGVPLDFFDHISGPHTLNCFANSNNHKLPRFYSRYWNPEVEGVDAFCHDCMGNRGNN